MNEQQRITQLRRAMKSIGMEPNGYGLAMCDDIHCRACKKHITEKAPWNVNKPKKERRGYR